MATLGTFTVGQVLTAAELNAIGTWTQFTPTWTSSGTAPAIGNGNFFGRYVQINKVVVAQYGVQWGSTTTGGTGDWRFGYPVAADFTDLFVAGESGSGRIFDLSAGNTDNVHVIAQPGQYLLLLTDTSGIVTYNNPWTFANGDEILFTAIYRAA